MRDAVRLVLQELIEGHRRDRRGPLWAQLLPGDWAQRAPAQAAGHPGQRCGTEGPQAPQRGRSCPLARAQTAHRPSWRHQAGGDLGAVHIGEGHPSGPVGGGLQSLLRNEVMSDGNWMRMMDTIGIRNISATPIAVPEPCSLRLRRVGGLDLAESVTAGCLSTVKHR